MKDIYVTEICMLKDGLNYFILKQKETKEMNIRESESFILDNII